MVHSTTRPASALLAALADTGLGGEQIAFFGHSTTVALNALLQRRGARTGLITTARFRDALEIGGFNRPEMYNLFYAKPTPLVASNLRREVAERVDSDDTVVMPLDEPGCSPKWRTWSRLASRRSPSAS